MRRAGDLDRGLGLLFLILWLPAFVLSAHSAWKHVAYAPVLVRAGQGTAYPVVTGFVPGLAGRESGLEVGDALLSVNGIDLAGAGPYTWKTAVCHTHGPGARLEVVHLHDGERRTAILVPGSYAMYWPRLLASLIFAGSVLYLLRRVRSSSMVRTFAATYACAALFFACTFGGDQVSPLWGLAVHVLSLGFGLPLALRATLLFPDGRRPKGAWARAGPWVFSAVAPLDVSRFYDVPFSSEVGAAAGGVLLLVYLAVCIAVLTRAYRRADGVGRRRIKWFLVGVYWAVVPLLLASALAAFDARFAHVLALGAASLALIPIFLVISITRYDLFDVDRVLSASASYTVLLVLLLAAMIAGVPRLAGPLARSLDLDPGVTELGLAAAVAGLVLPAHRFIHRGIDRILFVERYALEQGIAALVRELSTCASPEALTRLAGDSLERLIRPQSCVIYLRAAGAYDPAFVRGCAVPPGFDTRSPLVAALREHGAPLAGDELARGVAAVPLEPFERAALETLGVPMVLPVRRGGDLAAFICLGPKLSGDLYTPTDRNLLSFVAEKISGELQRFDQEQMLEASRRMQERL